MALQNFLVILKEGFTPEATDRTISTIKTLGGNVDIITGQGKAIIATFDNCFAGEVRKLPCVKLVGGVTIRPEQLARKRIVTQ
ncbi:MAG: hypothetical protein ISS52_02955 [Dehalococcoidia bacterium]|nr:hypothetical protein [Dehalococcoidia bacterium]